jgi:hypothetical protein
MSAHFAPHNQPQMLPEADPAAEFGHRPSTLTPLLAWARARGMADAFELLGKAALLIDASGGVLHVSVAAGRLLGESLMVASRHLIGSNERDNAALQAMIGAALTGASRPPIVLGKAAQTRLRLSVLPVPFAGDSYQLLRAILFIEIAG